MNRLLQSQLRRIAGIADDAALARALAGIERLLADTASPAAPPAETAALLRGLGDLLTRVDGSYEQYERSLALRTRSLELSSEELSTANDRLREELATRNRALTSLRETASALLGDASSTTCDASLAMSDLESLSVLMSRLVEQREAERRELDNQKFALDEHAIVSITDTAGRILYANRRFCEITGYARDELIGQTHRIVKSGLHPPAVYEEMWATISSGRVWHGEVCNRKKDGGLYWVAATIVPFLDAGGRPTRYIGIRTDITEAKATGVRLQEQLRLVEELVEAIPLPLYLKDTGGRYQRINQAFEKFFSVRRETLLGRTLHDLLTPEDASFNAGMDERLFREGGNQVYEARLTLRDGGVHDIIYRKAALTRPDGSISGLLGTIIDITERKRAEEAQRRAMEAAEAANRAKSDFLANMSHEIRTPMNGVIGMTELALGTDLDDEQREYLGIVKSSAESLLTIINDILDFSKIEAGRMLIERISFHLPRLIAETTKALALRAHEKHLELVVDVSPSLHAFVVGDPGRLRQVLVNLVGNAIKFTERGEIVVRIAPAAGDLVRLDISDTGIGIAEEKLGPIFEAFTQEDSSTTRRFGGTGLGLTISSRLVAMMNGRLWVDSRLGRGSTFHVEVPLPPDTAREEEEALPERSLAGTRVLVVDDNATNRRVLAETLAARGMAVESVASAAEALARLASPPSPDLIVLDAHMPEIDGFELAARLRDDPALAAVPRIMLSSGAIPGDAERCRALGIAAYFSKPCVPEELLAGIRSVLHGRRGDSEVPLVTRHSLREAHEGLEVLLVEDHPVNRKLAGGLLERWGHRVTVAENGQEALDRVAERNFDLILMDVQMPVMSGIEATQRLRLGGCRTKIVAMTANAMEGDREFCLEAGMDDYLAKPIKTDELHALLLGLRTGERAPAPARQAFDYGAALAAADAEIVEIIAPLFLEACGDDLDRLRTALAGGDALTAGRQIHTLRGLVATFGAAPATACALVVEEALQRGDMAAAGGALADFERELARLVAALREHGAAR